MAGVIWLAEKSQTYIATLATLTLSGLGRDEVTASSGLGLIGITESEARFCPLLSLPPTTHFAAKSLYGVRN
jgi:hypothetical protein